MIKCENLIKIYKTSDIEVVALKGLSLEIKEGEFMGIIGNSGSGKSTFLNMIGGLDRPSAGSLFVDGKNLLTISDKELIEYKRNTVGFVWQNSGRNLVPYLSAVQNIEIPMMINGKYDEDRALKLLDMVGLLHKKDRKLMELSGGEQQRVAIAIALSNNPRLLLADEPTGAVDKKTSDEIFALFKKLNEELKQTIVVVTHDMSMASKFGRVAVIRDGITSSEFIKKSYAEEISNLSSNMDDMEEEEQQEFVIVDKTGKLQLPADILEKLNLDGSGKVIIDYNDGVVNIRKAE